MLSNSNLETAFFKKNMKGNKKSKSEYLLKIIENINISYKQMDIP